TYKFHVLGDYWRTIRFFGTAESYSTQIGELAHCFVKNLYGRTNKNNATKQIAQLERHATPLCRAKQAAASPRNRTSRTFSENDDSAYTSLDLHHHISKLCKDPIHLLKFVQENPRDLA
ncbi:hypothetical protein B0H10DRAFT_1686406, partial [Mycena sp. CBHHK59/15]